MNKLISRMLVVIGSILIINANVFGQSTSTNQGTKRIKQMIEQLIPLEVGDTCPDILFENTVNYHNSSLRLSDFKNKNIIIDFWFIECTPCIAMLPKTEIYQKKFKDKLQVLPITFNKKKDVFNFFSKINDGRGYSLPCVTDEGAGQIRSLFKHSQEPHYVWLDKYRVVKAITSAEQVTEKNIDKFINGIPFNASIKVDPILEKGLHFNSLAPLLIDSNGGTKRNLIYHSALTTYLPGVPGVLNITDPAKIIITNTSIEALYRLAYREYGNRLSEFPRNRTFLEVKDSQLYTIPKGIYNNKDEYLSWCKDNAYCYDLVLPKMYSHPYVIGSNISEHFENKVYLKKLNAACKIIQEDLKRLFNLEPKIEKRELACLIVTCLDSNLLKTSGTKSSMKYDKIYSIDAHNITMLNFINTLEEIYYVNYPVVNETNFHGKFDLKLTTNLRDIEKVNRELVKYGLALKIDTRECNALILRDNHSLKF